MFNGTRKSIGNVSTRKMGIRSVYLERLQRVELIKQRTTRSNRPKSSECFQLVNGRQTKLTDKSSIPAKKRQVIPQKDIYV